jgi:formylglycine-generating enzyme
MLLNFSATLNPRQATPLTMAAHPQPGPATPIEPSLISIPEAWFLMGSASGQDCERPVHRVWVDAFLLAATQVTNAEYARFLTRDGLSRRRSGIDQNFNHPAATRHRRLLVRRARYCQWLCRKPSAPTASHRSRMGARRSRRSRTKRFPWGNDPPQSLPDYATRWQTGPEPVARYAPNLRSLQHLRQRPRVVQRLVRPNYYAISPDRNPRGPEHGQRKASRGGSWRHHVKVSRCSARSSIPPEFHYADYGFRVACDV